MENQKRQRGRPKSQFRESSAGQLQSLDRALGVLTAIAREESATLSNLARAVDVPTATVHRILTTLESHGYVAFDDDRQEWMIGIEAYRTGASFLKRSNVLEVGRPFLRRLMGDSGETANLAVPEGPEVVFVGQVETQNPIRAFFAAGTRTSMHASGTGKAILAAMNSATLERTLGGMEMTVFTKNTLSTRRDLEQDLAGIREQGWSFDREERHAGMSCVGAAIFDQGQEPCAGISVSGPSVRFESDRAKALGSLVAQAAREITRLIGGAPPDSPALPGNDL